MELKDIQIGLKAWFIPEQHSDRDLPGGGKWFYIPWQLIRERFDEVCPEWQVSYSQPAYLGDYCTITCTIAIQGISKQGVGNAEILLLSSSGKNMARGTPIERATADAFKNSAEAWGVARYLDEQTDPKTKADFIKYMQHRGDGRAADRFHQNNGNTPSKPVTPARSQAKPFGKTATNVVPIVKPEEPAEPQPISPAQAKRFWTIAKTTGFTSGGAKALIFAYGFESSKDITLNAYEGLCGKAADPDMMAIYNDRAAKESAAIAEPEF